MSLPSSGQISLGQVNTELSHSATANISLNQSDVRTLFAKSSGIIAMTDGYNKSAHVTFVAGSSSNNAIVNKPTGTQQGDVMVMVGSGTIAATWTPPTGWTDIFGLGAAKAGACYKVAGASEGSSYSYGNGSSFESAGIMTFRHAAVDVLGTANSNTGGQSSITTNSVTAGSANSMLIAMAANSSQIVPATPSGMTSGASNSTNTGYNMCYQEVAAGATGGKVFTGSGGDYAAGMLTLKVA